MNSTWYSFDSYTFYEYVEPIVVEEDGDYELFYFSVTNEGEKENFKGPFPFKIDQAQPTIDLSWDAENKLIIADAFDATSDIDKVEFFVNDEYVGNATEEPWQWHYPEEAWKRE